MAYASIVSASAQSALAANVVAGPVDSSGGDLATAVLVYYTGTGALSDDKSNFWTLAASTSYVAGYGTLTCEVWYSRLTSVGTGHNFTGSGGNAKGLSVGIWSGSIASPLDQVSAGGNNGGSSTTFTTGSITPTNNDQLVVIGMQTEGTDNPPFSLNGGFTILTALPGVIATSFGVGLGYLIQTSAAASNPTVTIATSSNAALGIQASFKSSGGGGGGGNPWNYYAQQRTKVERTWNRNGLLWHPSYAFAGVN